MYTGCVTYMNKEHGAFGCDWGKYGIVEKVVRWCEQWVARCE